VGLATPALTLARGGLEVDIELIYELVADAEDEHLADALDDAVGEILATGVAAA
jgi:hypothetical protein